jgi:hypothetical protein
MVLEGKVVDVKKQPISGVKLIAKQVQPIKGYEQFEATTDSEGIFKFKKLFPSSDYVIAISNKNNWDDPQAQVKTTAGPEGETLILKKPTEVRLTINNQGINVNPHTNEPRFISSNDKVITDSVTGLEWFVGPDRDFTFEQAKAWCTGLSTSGGGWSLPNARELKTLYKSGLGNINMDPMFNATSWYAWFDVGVSLTGIFDFGIGMGRAGTREENDLKAEGKHLRVFAVRGNRMPEGVPAE